MYRGISAAINACIYKTIGLLYFVSKRQINSEGSQFRRLKKGHTINLLP